MDYHNIKKRYHIVFLRKPIALKLARAVHIQNPFKKFEIHKTSNLYAQIKGIDIALKNLVDISTIVTKQQPIIWTLQN